MAISPVESFVAAGSHWPGSNDFDLPIDLSNSIQVDPFHGHYEENDIEKYQEPLGLSTSCTDPLRLMIVSSDKDIDLSNDYDRREQADYALHPFSSVQTQSNIPDLKLYSPSVIELMREPECDGEKVSEAE